MLYQNFIRFLLKHILVDSSIISIKFSANWQLSTLILHQGLNFVST